ncbi:hypothetical protein AB1K83_05195 [Sporosarcina sp. 179-K 3D1 HS]|uniref:hypothetical protein n=1 Tax=Sporosarcina sp. 179-K 3D1 HS TaxID=3232169 RepID=UPI0039A3DDE9
MEPTKRNQSEIKKRKAALSQMHVEMAEEAFELKKYREAVQEACRISEMENANTQVNNSNDSK